MPRDLEMLPVRHLRSLPIPLVLILPFLFLSLSGCKTQILPLRKAPSSTRRLRVLWNWYFRVYRALNIGCSTAGTNKCSKSNCFKADVTPQCLDENGGTHTQGTVLRHLSNLWCRRRRALSSAFRFPILRATLRPKALRD